jgi:hypothetical protein
MPEQETQYEAPAVEDIAVDEGPASVSAGGAQTPVIPK